MAKEHSRTGESAHEAAVVPILGGIPVVRVKGDDRPVDESLDSVLELLKGDEAIDEESKSAVVALIQLVHVVLRQGRPGTVGVSIDPSGSIDISMRGAEAERREMHESPGRSRIETVRTAYERFSKKDFIGVLDLCHPDVEHADVLRPGEVHRGRDAILQLWAERFATVSLCVSVAEILETDNGAIAIVSLQLLDAKGSSIGPPKVLIQRIIFRNDEIWRLEATVVRDPPDAARALLFEQN